MSAHEDDASTVCRACGATYDVHQYVSPKCKGVKVSSTKSKPKGKPKSKPKAELAKYDLPSEIEKLVVMGDLGSLTSEQRVTYVTAMCRRLGLDPISRPFDLIPLSGRLTLYLRAGGADQLKRVHGVSTQVTGRQQVEDVYVVTVRATDREGRFHDADGAVTVRGLSGEDLANALMKATTKANRRATIQLLGLGMLDESEFDTMGNRIGGQSQDPGPQRLLPPPAHAPAMPEINTRAGVVAPPPGPPPKPKPEPRDGELKAEPAKAKAGSPVAGPPPGVRPGPPPRR